MASSDGGKEVKTSFVTREGKYKLLPLSEYSKPTRNQINPPQYSPVRLSFIETSVDKSSELIFAFNSGRELFVYPYRGVRKAADLSKPIDKRSYQGTMPTSHDFNKEMASADSLPLLIGFSGGQIQLIDPLRKDVYNCKLFNKERQVDKSRVTCVRWLPGAPNQFVVSHSSGQLYVYNTELQTTCTQPPHYQTFKHTDSVSVFTCKTKSTRNPLYRWVVGAGAITHLSFSPDGEHLAITSADGYLRIVHWLKQELITSFRSYFGAFLHCAWSPDGDYIAAGGEDDLVTVFSMQQRRIVCRGRGHKSWINCVAFDSSLCKPLEYRLASVGDDTQLCLWDINEDVLRQPPPASRPTSLPTPNSGVQSNSNLAPPSSAKSSKSPLTNKFVNLTLGGDKKEEKKEHKRNISFTSKSGSTNHIKPSDDKVLGTSMCPRLEEVPLLEPLICKKISNERLTSVHFLEECFVTACYEGNCYTWSRPTSPSSMKDVT